MPFACLLASLLVAAQETPLAGEPAEAPPVEAAPEAPPPEVAPLVRAPEAAPPAPAAAVAPEGGPVRLVVMDLRNDGVTPATLRIVGDSLVVELTELAGLEVLSSEDVRRVADFDASRAAIGCDETSCLAELASALGAEVIVYGSIGMLGRIVVVHLNVFDSAKAKSVGRETIRANTIEELLPLLDASVAKLVARIPGVGKATPEPAVGPWTSPWTYLAVGGASVGALAAVLGGVVAGQAYGTYADTTRPARDRGFAQDRIFIGLGIGIPGVVVAGGSAVGLAFAFTE